MIHSDVVDAILTEHFPVSRELEWNLPTARPTWRAKETVYAAVRQATALGLMVPEHRVRWVYAKDRDRRGQAECLPSGDLEMVLNLAAIRTHKELRQVVWHEAMHLSDMAAGTFEALSHFEAEARAERFVALASRRYR